MATRVQRRKAGLFLVMSVIAITSAMPVRAKDRRLSPAAEADSLQRDYTDELPRTAPTPPDRVGTTFQIEDGFRIELVAAEPLVADPVAVAFDEFGRMFVVEMRGYSEDRDKDLGQVRLLEDTDQDGRFDKSTVYADHFEWPTAVACYDGGVFVGAAPDIFYLKDTDGDGKADVRRKVFTGFGHSNVQGLLNSFRWAMNNVIHGATSSSGGAVRKVDDPQGQPVVLRGRDFSFDPATLDLRATSGGAQHGLSFDRWGDKFVCSNSDHIQFVAFDDRYVARNPYLKAPNPRRSIAADGPAADVFRISPVEPWRIVRTRLRVKGIVTGPIEGGGRPAGYFTSATGVTIYRGDAWPDAYRGSALVGDVGSNLVHRKRIEWSGIVPVARRTEAGREFLASRDIWFRPVQFANTPGGNLLVIDMYREVIEHPLSLPPVIKKHLDLTHGRKRGRIYRIAAITSARKQQPVMPGRAHGAALVDLLDSANGWHRETAARLLCQQRDRAQTERLEQLCRHGARPAGRVRALHVLSSLGWLRGDVVLDCLNDVNPRVREHAVRVSEPLLRTDPRLQQRLIAMADDPQLRVRYQLAFSLGEFTGRARDHCLAKLARKDGHNAWIRMAIFSSLAEGADVVLTELLADTSFRATDDGRTILAELAREIAARGRPPEVLALIRGLNELTARDATLAGRLITSATQGAGSKGNAFKQQLAAASAGRSARLIDAMLAESRKAAAADDVTIARRVEAIRGLAIGSFAADGQLLVDLVDPRQPPAVGRAALSTLGRFRDPAVATLLIDRWASLGPSLRGEVLQTLFSRETWVNALLDAVKSRQLSPSEIDVAHVRYLLSYPHATVRKEAERLFHAPRPGRRQEVVEAYRGALERTGDANRGRQVFRKNCSTCHRLEGYGHEVGLNLNAIRNRGPETILISVLDPNREVDPKYLTYQAQTTDGRVLSGMIASETATSVTLKRADAVTDTILRVDIDDLRSTGLSMMPEGLEKEIDPQAMADLIAYLMSLR